MKALSRKISVMECLLEYNVCKFISLYKGTNIFNQLCCPQLRSDGIRINGKIGKRKFTKPKNPKLDLAYKS